MNTLLANQAIDLAIAAILSAFAVLIGAAAGYVQTRTALAALQIKQAEQAAQLVSLQRQTDQQAAAPALPVTTLVVPPGAGTIHVESAPVGLPRQAPPLESEA